MNSLQGCNILRHRAHGARPVCYKLSGTYPLQTKLILASSSPFRKQLLDRLHLDFDCIAPDIDETIQVGEDAASYVCRLAHAKAESVARTCPEAVVIGSDQCALLQDQILGKPGTHENALAQLQQLQGKTVVFHTGLCVLNLESGFKALEDVLFEVEFRTLNDEQLDNYLRMEEPYNCTGSFKSEGYGASLFRALRGEDPSALIGLPLLTLVPMLERTGIEVV